MNLKVGDPVIVSSYWLKPSSHYKNGYIKEIFELSGATVYRVYFYDESGKWLSGCNIFPHLAETIKLDIKELRDKKLKDLGI
jgi:hypothetical protein